MFDAIVIATGGSANARRMVNVAIDLVGRFDASIHALHAVDANDVEIVPDRLRSEVCDTLIEHGEKALAKVEAAIDREVTVAVQEGHPTAETSNYTREVDAGAAVVGVRSRHDGNCFLTGSVAERAVWTCPVPVLTARQLGEGTMDSLLSDEAV